MLSSVTQGSKVVFPKFTGERIYMQEFTKQGKLPVKYSHWQDTVDSMLDGIDCSGPIFLMVDQVAVKAGHSARRGGIHVDGVWDKTIQGHGGGRHTGAWDNGKSWMRVGNQGIFLASDVYGCNGFLGEYDDAILDGGSVDLQTSLEKIELEPSRCYYGDSLWFLHESVPLKKDTLRTVVRLNVTGDFH